MVAAFATKADLVARGWSGAASDQRIDQALADASSFLRGEIGWQVYPPATVTHTARDWAQVVHLPGAPIRSVTGVVSRGTTLPQSAYELDGTVLHLPYGGTRMTVTYEVGYETPPEELVAWTCVLAADTLARAADPDDTGGARPASESLADWRVTYSKRQQEGEPAIPQRVLERLRATYGTTAYVTS